MINKDKNSSNDEIDLSDIISTLFREKYLIFFITFISTFLSTIYVSRITPVWKGSFNVVVRKDSNEIQNNAISSFISGRANDNETQLLILESPSVLMPVFEYVRNYYSTKTGKPQDINFKSWLENSISVDFRENSNVLNVTYKSRDKQLILDVLDLVSKKYKDYSKMDTIKKLTDERNYLEAQKKFMSKKSLGSKTEFNNFTIDNRLGNIDGFIKLGPSNDLTNNFNPSQLEENNFIERNIERKGNTSAGQRFSNQFKLLEIYETDYVDLSSKLKPNSKKLIALKQKIENLNSALKRPNEILLKYDELYRNYIRDENFLISIEQKLEQVKLAQIKVLNPWEIISIPYIDIDPIYPKKLNLFTLSLFVSLTLGSISAFIKEKLSRKIYTRSQLEVLMECKYIDTIFKKEKELSFKQIINQFNMKKSDTNNYCIVNYKKKIDINFLEDLLSNKNVIKITNFPDKEFLDNSSKLLIILESGKYTFEDIEIINKYVSIYADKTIGWLFLKSK